MIHKVRKYGSSAYTLRIEVHIGYIAWGGGGGGGGGGGITISHLAMETNFF